MLEEMMGLHNLRIHTRIGASHSVAAIRGFTLIEMVVTLAVLGILLAIAAPQYNTFFEKFRTKRAAETLAGSLYLAKSEAIKRNQVVSLVVTSSSGGATWCYGLTTANTCDCTTANACVLDTGVETAVSSAEYRGVSLTTPASGTAFSFQPLRGTVTGNTVELHSTNDYEVHTVVSGFGRVKTCSPSTNHIGGGYTEC